MNSQCTLIIDSCCDLPASVVERPGVYLVKFPYLFGTQEHEDDLYQTTTPHDFYERMRKGEFPSTAQVSMTAYKEAFEWAQAQGMPCVYLSFSSGLSGSFNTACLVADTVRAEHPDFELHIVDTQLASIAEALLVYEAFNQREHGLTAAELAAWANEAKYFVNALFMVDDLESLRRGGRIPDAVAHAGAKLDVKPVLTFDLDGKLSLKSVARGRKKGIKQLVEYFNDRADKDNPSQCVVVADSDCPRDLERLEEMVAKSCDTALVLASSVGPVIGSHVGPNMIAIVFWGVDRRQDLSVADRIAQKVRSK